MTFDFKFRRIGATFWKTRRVIGYNALWDKDRMILYSEDGSIEEIAGWSMCHVKLGKDWVIATHKKMEKESGSPIALNVK